jgi:LuxR family maltose regulon positive regulatory protein
LVSSINETASEISSIPDDFALFPDDQNVMKSKDIHAGITFLLDYLPPKIHLVIAMRANPPPRLARFRGR